MITLINDIQVKSWDRWEDPGDYPSNAGASSMRPGPWTPERIEGCIVILMDKQSDWDALRTCEEEHDDYFGATVRLGDSDEVMGCRPPKAGVHYEPYRDFVILAPEFDCDHQTLEDVRESCRGYIDAELLPVKIPADSARALAELVATASCDTKLDPVMADIVAGWDKPHPGDPNIMHNPQSTGELEALRRDIETAKSQVEEIPYEDPIVLEVTRAQLARLYVTAQSGKLPNAHGENLARVGLRIIAKAIGSRYEEIRNGRDEKIC